MLSIFIISVIILIDQWTKYLAVNQLRGNDSITLINNFLFLTYTENRGAAFGIFQNGTYVLAGITFLIMLLLVFFLFKLKNSKLSYISISMILGGAAGNLVDRLRIGYVVDFIDVRFGQYHYPVFNAADSFVFVGTCVLAYYLLFVYKENQNRE